MADQDLETLTEYMCAATDILYRAGFVSSGMTQPVSFSGSRPDYGLATMEAIRGVGGPPVTFYFLDEHNDGPPYYEPQVVSLQRERGVAVVDIGNNCPDYCWHTMQPWNKGTAEVADRFITVDGTAGRLIDLIAHDAWLITVCHWQSIFSDGSRAGLEALDKAFDRLSQHVGQRLLWMTTSEIAQYRAATAACDISVRQSEDGIELELDASIPCPDFTLRVHLDEGQALTCSEVSSRYESGASDRFMQILDESVLLTPSSWRQTEAGIVVCLPLERGRHHIQIAWLIPSTTT